MQMNEMRGKVANIKINIACKRINWLKNDVFITMKLLEDTTLRKKYRVKTLYMVDTYFGNPLFFLSVQAGSIVILNDNS